MASGATTGRGGHGADAAAADGSPEDLACGPAALWLWRVPTLMIVVGAFWPAGRFWLWIPAFLVAGAACLANARRCGRTHCYVTGPLYLGAAGYLAATLLAGAPFHFAWFLAVVVGLSVLAQLAEHPLGRYRASTSSAGASTAEAGGATSEAGGGPEGCSTPSPEAPAPSERRQE